MNARERILSAVNKEKVDRIPCDCWYTPEILDTLKRHFGVSNDLDLWQKLKIDKIIWINFFTNIVPIFKEYIGPSRPDTEDVWGVRYKLQSYGNGMGTYPEWSYQPLATMETIIQVKNNYIFPKVEWFDFSNIKKKLQRYQGYPLLAGCAAPWSMYNSIRGLEESMMDIAINKEYAHYVIGKIFDFEYALLERLFEAGGDLIDFTFLADDFGIQSGLMISVEMFNEFFRPYYQRYIKLMKDFGIKVFFHSDGAIRPLIPILVELGIDVLNPIQWRCPGMNLKELKKNFGKALCFHGGVDNQEILPFGSPKDVEKEVIHCLDTLASDGTGYILSSCHNIQPNTPLENIVAMYESAHYYGTTR